MTALDHALRRSEKILASKGASKHACRFTISKIGLEYFSPGLTFCLSLSASVAVAALSYRFVEKPLKRFRHRVVTQVSSA